MPRPTVAPLSNFLFFFLKKKRGKKCGQAGGAEYISVSAASLSVGLRVPGAGPSVTPAAARQQADEDRQLHNLMNYLPMKCSPRGVQFSIF